MGYASRNPDSMRPESRYGGQASDYDGMSTGGPKQYINGNHEEEYGYGYGYGGR